MAITPEESELRRASCAANQADLRLEGLELPPEVQALSELFIMGALTPNEFRQACFAYAKTLANNPNWQPVTGPLPE